MKSKVWLLPLFLGASLSAVYFLPSVGAVAKSAVVMELPESSGNWDLENIPPTSDETTVLSRDTEFSKAIARSIRSGEITMEGFPVRERLDLSIVLSGADVNNSIHRPERCMPAQGHFIMSSSDRTLELSNGRSFPVKRLVSIKSDNDAPAGERERYVKSNCLTYYFFVGHDRLTNDHLARTVIDMKDRLVRGIDQRWAYVSATIQYGKVLEAAIDGRSPQVAFEVTEAEADTKLQAFLTQFARNQIHWEQVTP
ncbi:MAG: exosortase-associated EpsI family protein [Luteolibacter sp.]|uniref:exosortase-associated EpsI family protein n=1 Tax=Luteolibacter sp. TaxID=1962973 RepID=UPI0032667D6A